jgi:hypothetical protein
VRVQVENDSNAYLGITYPKEPVEFDCETTVEIGLHNQTKVRLNQVDAHVRGDGVTVEDVDEPDSIELGKKEEVDVTLSCDGGTGSESLEFDVSVAGDDTSIETKRSRVIELDCECTQEMSAWAFGGEQETGQATSASVSANSSETYGGEQETGQACDEGDNPFWTADNPDAIAIMESCTHQWRWGWYVTRKQLKNNSGSPTLYAGAEGNDLDKGTEIGTLWTTLNNGSCGEGESLFVNYSIDKQVGSKSIEVEKTTFTVVAKPEELLNNNEAVVPDDWDPKYHDKEGGQCIDVTGMNEFVLAAHATVTVTETDS